MSKIKNGLEKISVCGKTFIGIEQSRKDGMVTISHNVCKDGKDIGSVEVTLFDTIISLQKSITEDIVYDVNRQRIQDAANLFRANFGKETSIAAKVKEIKKSLTPEQQAILDKKIADMLAEFKL
jgi:CO dehydrogenase/acetyl-CoA synthase alpha subunit